MPIKLSFSDFQLFFFSLLNITLNNGFILEAPLLSPVLHFSNNINMLNFFAKNISHINLMKSVLVPEIQRHFHHKTQTVHLYNCFKMYLDVTTAAVISQPCSDQEIHASKRIVLLLNILIE